MTKTQELFEYLSLTNRKLSGVSLGDNPTSAEAVAGEILASLKRIDSEDYELVADVDE